LEGGGIEPVEAAAVEAAAVEAAAVEAAAAAAEALAGLDIYHTLIVINLYGDKYTALSNKKTELSEFYF
jgi:hypothetical protein